MANRNPEYWQRRFEEVLINNEKLAINFEKEMAKIYQELLNSTQAEIEAFYQRYSTSTGLDLADVRKRLDPQQLKRFKTQQKIYLAKIKELIDKGADLAKYEKTLKTLSAKAYVSRLQELQYNLNTQINILTGQQQVKMTDTLKQSYLQGYTQSMFALQKGVGFGYSFTIPNNDDVLKILQTPWNGNNYSDSIWKNKDKLTSWLNTNLPRHFAAGSSVPQMTKDLSTKLETNRKDAERLIRTEVNYISNQSTMDAYENSNVVDQYEILATLDSRTSETCRDMDGRVFNLKDKQVAVNMPPFHVRCRTTTIPYFPDEDLTDTQRVARDENGFTYDVPASVKYKEWHKHYGNSESVPSSINNLTKQVTKLSEKEQDTLRKYTGNSFYDINQYLTGKRSNIPNSRKDMIPILDKALDKGVSPDNLVVKRLADFDSLGLLQNEVLTKDDIAQNLIGKVLNNKAYMSTSLAEPKLAGRQATMIIDIPKGFRGLQYLTPIASEKYKNQYELLIKRNSQYKVTDVDLSGVTPVIFVELLL